MSYKTIQWNKLSENEKSPQKCQRQFAIDTSWKHVLENRARWRIFSRLLSQSRTRTKGPKTAASLSKSTVNKNHNEPYQQHLYIENVGKTLIHHQGIATDFLMWPSKFYQRWNKHLNLHAICLLRIEYSLLTSNVPTARNGATGWKTLPCIEWNE